MPDTLVRWTAVLNFDGEIEFHSPPDYPGDWVQYDEAADALSAATERERGLRDLLDLTTTELGWLLDGGLPNMATTKRYELAQAWLAEHKGTPRG
jgi:hypothetical protein